MHKHKPFSWRLFIGGLKLPNLEIHDFLSSEAVLNFLKLRIYPGFPYNMLTWLHTLWILNNFVYS